MSARPALIAEQSFPARQHRPPMTLVLRDMGPEEGHRFVTHWRNDQVGGYYKGTYGATLAEGLAAFDAQLADEMEAQAAVRPAAEGSYTWEIWSSHKDLGNDDCTTGDTHPTFAEALAALREAQGQPRNAHWGYACIEGPGGRMLQQHNPNPLREADDDLDRTEAAQLAGMAHGVHAYNEAMGEEVEEAPSFSMR